MVVDVVSAENYRRLDRQEPIPANKDLANIAKQFDACLLQAVQRSDSLEQHFTKTSSPFMGTQHDIGHVISGGQFVRTISASQEIMPVEPIVPQPITLSIPVPDMLRSSNNPSTDEFVKSLWPYAVQAASLIGLDPGVLIAQVALETGWGRSIAKDTAGNSSNNLFNIKAPADQSEQSVVIKTTEFIADKPIKMTASFKTYSTVEQSFQDYISLIKGSHRYQTALSNADNPGRYAEALQDAGYATDPEYANKILSIYQGRELRGAMERCGLHST